MARCEHNEELAIHSLTVKATVHYRYIPLEHQYPFFFILCEGLL